MNVHHAPSLFTYARHCRKGKWLPPRENLWMGDSMVPSETFKIIESLDKYFLNIYAREKGKRTDAEQDDKMLKKKFEEHEKEQRSPQKPMRNI